MRDLVEHHRARMPDAAAGILDDPEHPLRASYLDRFADREGGAFVRRFYREHRGESADQLLGSLVVAMRPIPKRIAAAHRSARPDAPFEAFDLFLRARLPEGAIDERMSRLLYDQLSPARMSPLRPRLRGARPSARAVGDRVPVAASRCDPRSGARRLERARAARGLRVASPQRPQERAGPPHPRRCSRPRRSSRSTATGARVGYPFDSLVPSYATAIGSSADRPAALAELLGILVNDGVRRPTERLARFHFGAGTPFETVLEREPATQRARAPPPRSRRWCARSCSASCAPAPRRARARRSSSPTAASSTSAARPAPATTASSAPAFRRRAPACMSRTASFVFTVGDRFYGTVVVYVPGEAAADYSFTSSAAVQVWNHLLPSLQPLFERPPRASEWTLFGSERAGQRRAARSASDRGRGADRPDRRPATAPRVAGRLPASDLAVSTASARAASDRDGRPRSRRAERGRRAGARLPLPRPGLARVMRTGGDGENRAAQPVHRRGAHQHLGADGAGGAAPRRSAPDRQPPALV